MDRIVELGAFLRSRRARLNPSAAGLPDTTRRRVPGLRREELAQLAGVSVDYYIRLEQGRGGTASRAVLEALARALRLDDAERAHLFDLAQSAPSQRESARPQRVRPAIHELLDTLDRANSPAFVLGRRTDVLASNRLVRALLTDFEALPARERNLARFLFLDEHARSLYGDWEIVAAETAAMLRMDAGRDPGDRLLNELIGELTVRSEPFRRYWAEAKVCQRTDGVKRYNHPLVGELTLTYQAMVLPGADEQTLFSYTTTRDSASDTALRLLASWTGSLTAASAPPPRGR